MIAAYVRVSTVGQNEAGQRAEIARWVVSAGKVLDFHALGSHTLLGMTPHYLTHLSIHDPNWNLAE
jgi:hypothetical protein